MVGGSVPLLLQSLILGSLISITGTKKMGILLAKQNMDLAFLVELYELGKIKPIIDKQYSLKQVPEAFRYFGEGRARGKIIIQA